MGVILTRLTRPIRNFNIESRAHKVLDKEKPVAAPLHKVSLNESERLLRENPESFEQLLRKDEVLHKYLHDVYVKSHDIIIETKQSGSDKPLPLNRRIVEYSKWGLQEPKFIPIGRCTLKQTLHFLSKHHDDPILWNSTKIAIDYSITEDKIKNILHYFRVYKVHIPQEKTNATFAEPSTPKVRLRGLGNKLLGIEEENDKKK